MDRKNVFGMNVDDGRELWDGDELIVRRASLKLEREQQMAQEEYAEHANKASIPKYLHVVKFILMIVGLVTVGGFLRAIADGTSFATAWSNGWFFLVGGLICLGGYGIIMLVEKKKNKEVVSSEEYAATEKRTVELIERSMAEIGIPSNAIPVDVFVSAYKIKNGKQKNVSQMVDFCNPEMNLFVEDGNLCIADLQAVVSIPLSSLERIVEVKKRCVFNSWNKPEPPNKGDYKKFKVTTTNLGTLSVKPYYSLQFAVNGRDYEVLIPPYDLGPFIMLTHLSVTVPEK